MINEQNNNPHNAGGRASHFSGHQVQEHLCPCGTIVTDVRSDVKFSSEGLGVLIALLPGVTGFITVLGVDALGITVLVADETSKVFLFALYASRPVQLPVDPLSAAFAALLAVHDSSCLETKS